MSELSLPGLKATEPIGFLAALGLLRVLQPIRITLGGYNGCVQLHLVPGSCGPYSGGAMVATPVADAWRIPDDLWPEIEMHLPRHVNAHRFGGGRPRTPDRVCMDAILFVLRTGCQWKALDATRFCPGSTAHDRFQEWVEAGVFAALWETGLLEYD